MNRKNQKKEESKASWVYPITSLVVSIFLLAVFFTPLPLVLAETGLDAEVSATQAIKEPYLVSTGDPTSMTVAWQANQTPSESKIEWGDSEEYLGGEAVVQESGSGAWGHQFFYTIENLNGRSIVYYRVTIDGTQYESSFVTQPYDSAQILTFYSYGDTRSDPAAYSSVAGAIVSDMAADMTFRDTFVLHTGDFTANGERESSWSSDYFSSLAPMAQMLLSQSPILGTIGNHETYSRGKVGGSAQSSANLFRKYWPYPFYETYDHFYYSYDVGPVHVAVVDLYTADYTVGSEQYEWLEEDLASSTKLWKVVSFHEPAWSAGGHENNTTIQDNLTPLFEEHGVKLVLQGHNHYYARAEVNGVTYLTIGGGGAPLYTPDPSYPNVVVTDKSYQYSRFDIVDNTLQGVAFNTDLDLIDSFEIEVDPQGYDGFILATPYSDGGPQVRSIGEDGTPYGNFMAYDANLRGSFQALSGDIDGDGVEEIVTAPGGGFGPHVRAFEKNGVFLDDFFAYEEGFRGGVNILLADLNNDGKDEVITTPASGGGPNIRVYSFDNGAFSLLTWTNQYCGDFHGGFSLTKFSPGPDQAEEFIISPTPGSNDGKIRHFVLSDGELFSEYRFEPYGNFLNGIIVATGDLDGDNVDEIITAPATDGGPNLRVYKYHPLEFQLMGFAMAYDENMRGGYNLVTGDYNADGKDEVTVAPLSGGGPNVRTYAYQDDPTLVPINGFFAYDQSMRHGVNLAAGDLDQDGYDELVTAPRGGGPNTRVYNWGSTGFGLDDWFWAFGESFEGGVNLSVAK